MKRLAIITGGGGMNCAYSSGFLCGLAKEKNITSPFLMIGSSGSAGNIAYYVAGQFEELKDIWMKLLYNKKFIDLRRKKKRVDVDYLIDTIFKKIKPLNIKKLKKSTTKILISATEIKTGKLNYFNLKENCLEVLRATAAIPFFYGKAVEINSIKYFDGDPGGVLISNMKRAKKEKPTHILIIDDTPKPLLVHSFWKLISAFSPPLLQEKIKEHIEGDILSRHFSSKRTKLILPRNKLSINPLNNKRSRIKKTFNAGYKDAKKFDIEKFLAI